MIGYLFAFSVVISGLTAAPRPESRRNLEFQSPINIITSDVEKVEYQPIVNYGNVRNLNTAKITNTGRTIRIEVGDEESKALITGGPMQNSRYKFAEAHFHWGTENSVGAETQIDGKIAPMELHMVFYNAKYLNKEIAMDMDDGLVVLAALYEISPHNQTILAFTERFDEISESVKSMDFVFYDRNFAYFLPINSNSYYTYHGSLTTPPYSEAVTWIVFTQTMPISGYQLEKFRKLKNGNDKMIGNNFRSIQQTYDRPVYQNTYATDLLYFLFEFVEYALYTDA